MSRSYSAGSHYHVVIFTHSYDSFNDFSLVVGNDFNSLQFNPQFETVFRYNVSLGRVSGGPKPKWAELVSIVFEERTSSPMTRQPAVLIVLSDKEVIVVSVLVRGS